MTSILIPVSAGELIDKITILEIKKEHIQDAGKLSFVLSELSLLQTEYDKLPRAEGLLELVQKLKEANMRIWGEEETVREKGYDSKEGMEAASRSHKENDERFRIKRAIDALLGSEIREVKSHQG